MPKVSVTHFDKLSGHGEQLGWCTVAVAGSIAGLQIGRVAVFRPETAGGRLRIALPLALGTAPGARHDVLEFDHEHQRQRLLDAIRKALAASELVGAP